MLRPNLRNLALLIPLFAALAACSTTRPQSAVCPMPGGASLTGLETSETSVSASLYNKSLAETMSGRAAANPTRPVEINAITFSAGGQWGAFGAGLLSGWSDRPEFDLVTGVSTGAFLAGPAFAGQDFDEALELYNGLSQDEVVTVNPLYGLLGQPAATSVAPLERSLRKQVTPALLDRMAERHSDGNRLVVGATNIDTTEFEVFDLGALAAHGADNGIDVQDCVVEVLLASAAIPVAMPPRHINNALYADGGLRDQVFFREIERVRLAAEEDLGRAVKVNAFIIVNGDLEPPKEKVEDSLISYAVRSLGALTDEILRDSIFEAVQFAKDQGNWTVRGIVPKVDFEGKCSFDDSPSFTFDECLTKVLFEEGKRIGQSGSIPWLDADEMRRLALEY